MQGVPELNRHKMESCRSDARTSPGTGQRKRLLRVHLVRQPFHSKADFYDNVAIHDDLLRASRASQMASVESPLIFCPSKTSNLEGCWAVKRLLSKGHICCPLRFILRQLAFDGRQAITSHAKALESR